MHRTRSSYIHKHTPGHQLIHASKVVILVVVQQVLELVMEDLQVLLDEHLLARLAQLLQGCLVEVHLHPPLFLQQSCLCLQG